MPALKQLAKYTNKFTKEYKLPRQKKWTKSLPVIQALNQTNKKLIVLGRI